MTVSQERVREALAANGGGRVSAKVWLRQHGETFTDSDFSNHVASIVSDEDAIALPEPTGPVIGGSLEAPDERRNTTAAKTLVFTSAQSNTVLNEDFFLALEAYCEHRGAELHISRFTYNKASHGKKSVKPGSGQASDHEDLWFDPRIAPYASDVSLEIVPDLIFCGELNVIPTRINPLSSFKNYTRNASAIIPHAKMCMESVPTMKRSPAKFLYTTGTVTARNYIQKAAGQVADFHHVFGALVVEIDDNGEWWVRQLNADKTGGFYDLNTHWTRDGLTRENCRVHAITHGDIHGAKLDKRVAAAVFEPGGIVDQLRPHEQHFHDTIDFMPRNHHNIGDPHFLHAMFVKGTSSVEAEINATSKWLTSVAYRGWSHHFIIVSNHDQAIEGWLRNTTAMSDPANARYWHEINAWCFKRREDGFSPHAFTYALSRNLSTEFLLRTTFLQEDDSYLSLGQIEIGLHGHLGPNGARGNPKNLRTVGRANTAHTHSAGITEGIYTAGVYGSLDMGYNKGLSSWSHSLIVTYPNAKRAILTIKGDHAWRTTG